MNANFFTIMATVAIVLFISFLVSGVIKLKMYDVKSKMFYVLAPLFPVIVLILNILSVMTTDDEKIKSIPQFQRFCLTAYVSFAYMPLFLGSLCSSAKFAENEVETMRNQRKKRLRRQTEMYSETAIEDCKMLFA